MNSFDRQDAVGHPLGEMLQQTHLLVGDEFRDARRELRVVDRVAQIVRSPCGPEVAADIEVDQHGLDVRPFLVACTYMRLDPQSVDPDEIHVYAISSDRTMASAMRAARTFASTS